MYPSGFVSKFDVESHLKHMFLRICFYGENGKISTKGPIGSPWAPMGLYGTLCDPMGPYGTLWDPMGPCGTILGPLGNPQPLCMLRGMPSVFFFLGTCFETLVFYVIFVIF